jgi:hypothetical protein
VIDAQARHLPLTGEQLISEHGRCQ